MPNARPLDDTAPTETYPVEVHITVRNPDLDAFRAFCADHDLKPIILDLQTRTGTSVLQDVMTAKTYHVSRGGLPAVYYDTINTTMAMTDAGFEWPRIKMETVPWHPLAQFFDAGKLNDELKNVYYEAHIQVFVQVGMEGEIAEIAKDHSAHISRNVYKKGPSDDVNIYIMTLRPETKTAAALESALSALADDLRSEGFAIRKMESEFVVTDTKRDHDKAWTEAQ